MTNGFGEVYINVPSGLLEDGTLLDLPAAGLMLEVLEDVTDPDRFRPVLQRHRAAGFRPTVGGSTEMELLRAVRGEELDLSRVETLIRNDVRMADRFLRLVRLHAGWRQVESIRHGLVLLGHRSLRRWLTLVALSSASQGAPTELLTMAGIRASYCEGLERLRPGGASLEAFGLGMFSVLGDEGILTEALAAQLPVGPAVAAALAGRQGVYRSQLSIALAAERADWETMVRAGEELGLGCQQLTQVHVEALRSGQEMALGLVA